jgi:uncharacterized membrane protein YgcG
MNISRLIFTSTSAVFFNLSVSFLTASSVGAGSTIYTYTEDSGTQAFTTELHSIPEQYRGRVVPLHFDHPPETPPAPPPVSAEPPPPSENTRTVAAVGEYRMGDFDTRTDAVRLAVEAAKRDALEQVATYLESVTEVRDLDVTRDDIRTYTAGVVKVLNQKISTRLEEDTVVVRADLTAQVDPNEAARAITALRQNESAKNELNALRAETDQLQQQLDAANRALADAASPEQVHTASEQREEVLNELQANALVSQAWTSAVYATPGVSAYPWIGGPHVNGLLLQAQRLYPRHRHLRRAQQFITAHSGHMPAMPPVSSAPHPHSLLVPSPPGQLVSPPPRHSVAPGSAGAIVGTPTSKAAPSPPSVPPSVGSSTRYQLHPSHFWRPSPPNIHTSPAASQPKTFVSPPQVSGQGKQFGGGGQFRGGGNSGGGRRGR